MARDRLSFGDFSTRADMQALARRIFVQVMDELEPDVLAALRDEVWPVYVTTFDAVDGAAERWVFKRTCRRDVYAWRCAGEPDLSDELARRTDLLPLHHALESWMKDCYVTAPFMREGALTLLGAWRGWSVGPNDRVRRSWPAGFARGWGRPIPNMPLEESRFTFDTHAWDPTWYTFAWWEDEVRASFERQLQEHADRTRKLAAATDGFEHATQYRSLRKHAVWTVRHQVLREPWPAIAATADRELKSGRTEPVTPDAVPRAVKAFAALIDLHLVPVRRRGRPTGSRDADERHTT